MGLRAGWVLQLEIISASGIKACDSNGKSDPYVVASVVCKEEPTEPERARPGILRRQFTVMPSALQLKANPDNEKIVATTAIKFGQCGGAPCE